MYFKDGNSQFLLFHSIISDTFVKDLKIQLISVEFPIQYKVYHKVSNI